MSAIATPPKKKRRVTLPVIDVPQGQRVVQFYSKSKENAEPVTMGGHSNWRRYISNFQHVPQKNISYDGKLFPSVEHVFAYVKYKYSTSSNGSIPPNFESDQPLGNENNIKSEHSRAGMKKHGFAMDVQRFDNEKERLMREFISKRAEVDPEFREILLSIARQNLYLLHFARGGGGGWGGYQSKQDQKYYGRNLLGKLMMEWASNHLQPELKF